MTLVKCSECGREISDNAAVCPGCGAPMLPAPERVRRVIARAMIGLSTMLVLALVVFGLPDSAGDAWLGLRLMMGDIGGWRVAAVLLGVGLLSAGAVYVVRAILGSERIDKVFRR